jgi:hypothetical protein
LFKNTCKTVYSLLEHLTVVCRRSRGLVYYCVQRAATNYDPILVFCIFPAKQYYSEWAMLGSNQRPLPCESRSITSWLFAGVQKYLQNCTFASTDIRTRSQLFVWVGVLIGVVRVSRVRDYLHYTWAYGQLSPMAVAYPHVLSACIVGRGKGTRKRAEAESFGPSLLLGIYVNPKVLRKHQPRSEFPVRSDHHSRSHRCRDKPSTCSCR